MGGYGELDVAGDCRAVWAVGARRRSEIQVEDRHRPPADGRDEVLHLRLDHEVRKRDPLAAVAQGQRPGVINGSGERRYDDLAAADGKAQRRRVSGGGSDGGDGDTGSLESSQYR